ncbi:MAG: hypothetical protein R3D26_20490 [Cyanobacteriota/Melainabacteria group bacterium]
MPAPRFRILLLSIAALLLSLSPSLPANAANEAGIGWIPTWKQGIAEANRTKKPILLVSAAPQCGGVPGEW